MCTQIPRQGSLLVAVILLLLPFLATGAEPPAEAEPSAEAEEYGSGSGSGPASLRYEPESGVLTLNTKEAPLAEVLDEIAESVGIEFIHSGLSGDLVTLSFERLPVADALKRVLSHRGYMIQVNPDTGRPARVWVMARKSYIPPTPTPPSSPPAGVPDEARERLEAERADAEALLDMLGQEGFGDEETERLIRALIEQEDKELLEELRSGLDPNRERE